MESFNEHCAIGIEPNRERIDQLLDQSLMLVTASTPISATIKRLKIAKKAHEEGLTLKNAALALGYLSADRVLTAGFTAGRMVGPFSTARHLIGH
ncbi:hypothetical protein ACNKHO_10220 [Shigella flexneri]